MIKPVVHILIVDDEVELRRSLKSVLVGSIQELTLEIHEAKDGIEALEWIQDESHTVDVVFMDVRMPRMSGLEALKRIKEWDPRIYVIIMTAHAHFQDAILAIKEGAYDYIEKPMNSQKLIDVFKKTVLSQEMVSGLAMSNPILDDDVESEFVGSSTKMKEIFKLIYKLSRVDTTVLIRGENGTGKELVARAIHSNSTRKHGPFKPINCGAIPEQLMESELFGHEKGAFTGAIQRKIGLFQMANEGTLFLDEIGELKPGLQVKLLRVLQEKKFTPVGGTREIKTNARIIAATNRNLEAMIEEGSFREDLFYRLSVLPIFLPPLRERLDDIDSLVQYFIKKFSKTHVDSPISNISEEALQILKKHHWPGNIRELENTIERSFIMETGSFISPPSLPEEILRSIEEHENLKTQNSEEIEMRQVSQSGENDISDSNDTEFSKNHLTGHVSGDIQEFNFEKFKELSEKEFLTKALEANRGRINQTVARANIPKNTLLRKIKKYQIDVKRMTSFFGEG